eukprot:scaffold48170_cov36-Tisochrysis_lutea.AAC.2
MARKHEFPHIFPIRTSDVVVERPAQVTFLVARTSNEGTRGSRGRLAPLASGAWRPLEAS